MRVSLVVRVAVSGLGDDVKILQDLFAQVDEKTEVVLYETKTQKSAPKADIAVYIEHIPNEEASFDANYKIWIPNQEFVTDYDTARVGVIDAIWCKTHHGMKVLSAIADKKKLIYTGWYTHKPYKFIPFSKKNKKLAIHMAGISSMKGTLDVIKAWQHRDIPDIDLFVCIGNMAINNKESKKIFAAIDKITPMRTISNYHGIELKGFQHGNITFCADRLDATAYLAIISKALWHVLPSRAEGFGHSINITRMVGSISVTTDAGPMNELITDDSGFLVPVKYTRPIRAVLHPWIDPKVPEFANYISADGLVAVMKTAAANTDDELLLKITNANTAATNEKKECIRLVLAEIKKLTSTEADTSAVVAAEDIASDSESDTSAVVAAEDIASDSESDIVSDSESDIVSDSD